MAVQRHSWTLRRVPSVLVFVCARMHISAPGHMFGQRHLWTRNGSQVPSGLYVSGYTLVFRITCSVRGTCEPTLGPKCLLVCMHPDTLSCSGLHVLCKRCSWTHLGPEQPLRCPKAFVYVAGVLVGPSGPRVTPLPVFMCVCLKSSWALLGPELRRHGQYACMRWQC